MPSIDLMYAMANDTVDKFRERKARNRRNWWDRIKQSDPVKYQEELRKAAARYQRRKLQHA